MERKINGHWYVKDEDGEWVCAHYDAYVDPACCSPFDIGSSGYIECGCGGHDSVVCPNPACTGLLEHEIERIFADYNELPLRSQRR